MNFEAEEAVRGTPEVEVDRNVSGRNCVSKELVRSVVEGGFDIPNNCERKELTGPRQEGCIDVLLRCILRDTKRREPVSIIEERGVDVYSAWSDRVRKELTRLIVERWRYRVDWLNRVRKELSTGCKECWVDILCGRCKLTTCKVIKEWVLN